MLRSFLVKLCTLLLRVFFRRIEVVGKDRIPDQGSVVFAINHPSGLVDPLFVLCLSGRRVSFLAKAPLFHMPFVSIFVKAFESLPVYRASDGADPHQNRKMMQAAEQLLSRGNAIAIFPEGTSHSDLQLKPFKTGAARIALSARALSKKNVQLIPVALYFDNKTSFRSRAVVSFGPPLPVPEVELDEKGEAPPVVARQLTDELKSSLEALIPGADSVENLLLSESAERIFSAALTETPELCPAALQLESAQLSPRQHPSLSARMIRRRQIIDAYLALMRSAPQRVEGLVERVRELSAQLAASGLPADANDELFARAQGRHWASRLQVLVLFPFALIGIVLHAPAYQLVRYIAFRYSGPETDVLATVKLVAGMALFPLTWLIVAILAAISCGDVRLLGLFVVGPILAWLTVLFQDHLGGLYHRRRLLKKARRASFDWQEIRQERAAIAQEMAELIQANS